MGQGWMAFTGLCPLRGSEISVTEEVEGRDTPGEKTLPPELGWHIWEPESA